MHDLLHEWFTLAATQAVQITQLAQVAQIAQVVEPLADFGVSGLLAMLWLKERRHAQKREHQLNQTHERLIHDRVELQTLVSVVRTNTKTLENFARSYARLARAIARKYTQTQSHRKTAPPAHSKATTNASSAA